jgi:DNA polymerase III epsilon subunit-like protein
MSVTVDRPADADSAAAAPALPCVIDIEASGFGRGSYPIEIGFVLPDGSAYCTLIQPDETWTHWDEHAERIHGITRALLRSHGRAAKEVAAELNDRLAGRSVYCDNWAHDYAWLARLFDAACTRPSFRLRHLRELLSEPAAERFDDARDLIERSFPLHRHRASSDARVLQLSVAKALEAGDAC